MPLLMMKRGIGLKKKRICNNVRMNGVFSASIFFLIGVLITVQAIQKIVLVSQGDEGVIEYQGEYEFVEKRYLRNTNYRFVLENGDIINVYPEDLPDHVKGSDFKEHSELTFKYSKYKNTIIWGTHTCISISTVDSEIELLESATMNQDIKFEIVMFSVWGLSMVFISIFVLILSVPCLSDSLWKFLFKTSCNYR